MKPYHPYSESLKSTLSKHEVFSEIDVIDNGLDGDKARIMIERLRDALESTPFKLVIILAGSNDLGTGSKASDVLVYIKRLHELAYQFNC